MWGSADSYLDKIMERKRNMLNNLEKIYDENKDDELVVALIDLLVDEQISHNISKDNANTIYNQYHTLQLKTTNFKEYVESNRSLIDKLNS